MNTRAREFLRSFAPSIVYVFQSIKFSKMAKPPLELASEIMLEFSNNTHLRDASAPPRRYLWTDSFAVCNFIELYKQTGDEKFKELALSLMHQVHQNLGKHRPDDSREGWISGLSPDEGEKHPTSGGLRIGKKLPERSASDAYDDRKEWDRDGQYYHYVTKWMHALVCMSKFQDDSKYSIWAAEMAKAVHAKFTYSFGRTKRMYWKMSIDLSRPQVLSMGHHDPLDGYITYQQIQASVGSVAGAPDLSEEMSEMAGMCAGRDWVTGDSLGLGGLLCDAYRVLELMSLKQCHDERLLEIILKACGKGLGSFARRGCHGSAESRLAFRELGLAIGLQTVQRMRELIAEHPELAENHPMIPKLLGEMERYTGLVDEIVSFWSNPSNRKSRSWNDHLDINMVMWATTLLPGAFFTR